jgi:hypothetical protein
VFIGLGIGILILTVAFFAFLGWNAYEHYHAKYIDVKKIQFEYADLTEKLTQYPQLKKVMEMPNCEMSLNEFFKLKDELGKIRHFRIGEKYYEITLYDGIVVQRLDDVDCKETECKELYFLKEKLADVDERRVKVVKAGENVESIDDSIKGVMEGRYDIVALNGFILTNTSRKELYKAKEFEGGIIKFKGECYKVFAESKVFLKEPYYSPTNCREVSEWALSNYPTLESAIEIASKNGEASLKTQPEEWERTFDFMQNMGCSCIEVNGSYYEIGFATA